MAYFEPSIDAEGIHVPDYNDILAYLVERYTATFGEDAYIGEETKDYQLLSIYAKCLSDFGALLVQDYNSRNPNYARGNSLDLLLPLVSMSRRQATYSTVVLSMTGTEGTVIPEGSIAIDDNGNMWVTQEPVTLDANGEGSCDAECSEPGAISAPINTITQIYEAIDGWESVTNEVVAFMGEDTETDAEVRARRKTQLATQNNGLFDALYRAINDIETIVSIALYVNNESEEDDNGIPGHSICAVVKGSGDANETAQIAEAIWKAKAPGIGTYGANSGTYKDSFGNDNTIYFTRATSDSVTVNVYLNALDNYDSTRCTAVITEALTKGINGLGVGKSWSVTTAYRDIYNAFANEECPFVLTSVTGKTSGMESESAVEVPCTYNKILVAGTITVNVNA